MAKLSSSHHRQHKLGGCSGTRHGCCPNSDIPKVNRHGSNCPNHHRDSRIHHIGYHHRRDYHPIDFVPIVRRPIVREPIIRQPIIVNEVGRPTASSPLEFNYINLIITLILIIFFIFMVVRIFH